MQLGPELSAMGASSKAEGGKALKSLGAAGYQVPKSHSGRCHFCRLCLPFDPKMSLMVQHARILYRYQGFSMGSISLAGEVYVGMCVCVHACVCFPFFLSHRELGKARREAADYF